MKAVILSSAGIGFAALLAYLYFRDDPLEDHSDLAVTPLPFEKSEGIWEAWAEACRLVDDEAWDRMSDRDPDYHERLRGDKPWDASMVDSVLAANRASIEAAFRADKLGPFVLPPMKRVDEPTEYLTELVTVVRNLELEALARFHAGNMEGALDVVEVGLRFSNHCIEGSNSLLSLLLGSSWEAAVLETVENIGPDRIAAHGSDRIDRLLAIEAKRVEAMTRIVRIEFGFIAQSLRMLKDGDESGIDFFGEEAPPRFLVRTNRTTNEAAQLYRRVLADAEVLPIARLGPPTSSAPEGVARYRSNAFGSYVMREGVPVFWMVMENGERVLARRRALRLKIALLRFHADEGSLPGDLEDLVPRYLESVPLDPYDGAPIRYDAGGGAIWVIGKNLVDDGGAKSRDEGEFRSRSADPTMFIFGEEP